MPTLTALSATTVNKFLKQTPAEALDVDGYEQMCLYLKVAKVQNGGSTLDIEVYHAPRNANSDYLPLWKKDSVTSSYSTLAYIGEYTRFLRVGATWRTPSNSTTADVEILVVPKLR